MALIYLNISSFEIFLQYHEETNGEVFQGEPIKRRPAYDPESWGGAKKVVEVPISLSSRGVTVAGLSPGSVYSFTLRAARPDGLRWTLGQTQTAYTSQSSVYLFKFCTNVPKSKCLCCFLQDLLLLRISLSSP